MGFENGFHPRDLITKDIIIETELKRPDNNIDLESENNSSKSNNVDEIEYQNSSGFEKLKQWKESLNFKSKKYVFMNELSFDKF